MIIAFGRVSACRAFGIVLWRSTVDYLAGRKVPKAQLECEYPEFLARSECSGERVPVDGFDGGVGPEEAVIHVEFHEAKAVLATDGGREFAGDGNTSERQLYLCGWKERYMGACGGELAEFGCSEDVGVTVKLGG
jgi:hypothetical protein